MKNKWIKFTVFLIFICLSLFPIKIDAHSSLLDVGYDVCNPNYYGDSENETWFFLSQNHNVSDNYAFNDIFYSWTKDIDSATAQELKNAYVESMENWNNVVYYKL